MELTPPAGRALRDAAARAYLAPRARHLRPNGILAIAGECRRLQARGQRVVDLTVGEPEFPTPPAVVSAVAEAIAEGRTRYTPSAGATALRAALCRHLSDEGLQYLTGEVMATSGASGALSCALQALVAPGCEVLVAVPYYPDYLTQIGLAGGSVAPVATQGSDDFKLTPAALRRSLTPRSRVLLLNNPVNPTGAVYGEAELRALTEAALDAGLFIVSDEVYCHLTYGTERFTSVGALGPDVRGRSVLVRSLSKTYAMTGWRIGYAAGPQFLVEAMSAIQGAGQVAPCSLSQWAALAALGGAQEARQAIHASLRARRARLLDGLAELPGVHCLPSAGALFVFADLGLDDTADFCRLALHEHGVALVPGREFGLPSGVRLSFVRPEPELDEGLARFGRALVALRGY